MPKETDYDLSYRPGSYWNIPPTPWARIQGQVRRQAIRDAFESGVEPDMPAILRQDSLPAHIKDGLTSIDPRLRGGEDLPEFAEDEVEIARIRTPLTVHAEVTSIRARRSGGQILYRVVDE